jgi:hypothetical protein
VGHKRLAFGGLNSQNLFDAEIEKIISGIPRVLNNRDDIMIGGLDWKDHNKNLQAVLYSESKIIILHYGKTNVNSGKRA